MNKLRLGDHVQVSSQLYEPVYSFGHRSESINGQFIKLHPTGLELTPDHLLLITGKGFLPASMVEIGDLLSNGVEVSQITSVTREGVYAPFTSSGTLIVDGALVSSFVGFRGSDVLQFGSINTHIKYHWLAHVFETPHRMWCRFGRTCVSESYSEDGVSLWVAAPWELVRWLFDQTPLVATSVTIPLLSLLVCMRAIEGVVYSGASAAATAFLFLLCIVCWRRYRRKSVSYFPD